MYYQFDQYLVDAKNFKLHYKNNLLSDDEKTIRLLSLLCDAYPEVVDKEFLILQLWPDQVVTDWSLSKLVSDTRQLLDATKKDQNHIKTIRGRGFRFNSEVIKSEEKPTLDNTSEPVRLTGDNSSVKKTHYSLIKKLSYVVILAILLFVSTNLGWEQFQTNDYKVDDQQPIRIAVLPVMNDSDDPINEWIKYGIMSMVTEQLRHFSSIQVIPSSTVIPATSGLPNDLTLINNYSQYFNDLCSQIGCSHIVELRYNLEKKHNPSLSYQIYSKDKRSVIKDFSELDVIDATDLLLSYLVKDLVPVEHEFITLADTFSNDKKANRDYAIGVNELIAGDSNAALSYLQLAIKRKPDFFWANARMAEAHYRSGNLELSSEQTKALRSIAKTPREAYFLDHLNSNLLYSLGHLDDSLDMSLSLQKNIFATDNPQLLGNELLNIGSSYQAKGQLDKASEYLLLAQKQYKLAGYGSGEGKALFNLANVYLTNSGEEKAITYYQKAREVFLKYNMPGYELMAKHQIATTSISLGKLKYAESELANIVKSYRQMGDLEGELTAAVDLIYLSIVKKDYKNAAKRVESALSQLNDTKLSYLVEHARTMAVLVHLRLQDTQKAEEYFNLVKGEWKDPRPNFAFIPAHLQLAKGEIDKALATAQHVKVALSADWTQSHQAILAQFENAKQQNKVIPITY